MEKEYKNGFWDYMKEYGLYTVGIISIAVTYIIGDITEAYKKNADVRVEIERIKSGLEEHVLDVNNNGIHDKVYFIDGKIVPIEIDNKNVLEYFKK